MDAQMTPEAFCWLYAAGCVELLYQTGDIDKKEYDTWRSFVDKHEKPPDKEIRKLFDKPFRIVIEKFGVCTLDGMRWYWRQYHLYNPEEETPVELAEVLGYEFVTAGKRFVKVKVFIYKNTYRMQVVENPHRYNIKPGSNVLVHANVVAEIASY